MEITIATNKPATASFVFSLDNSKQLSLPILYFGDIFELIIEAGDGVGGLAEFAGRADVILEAGVGIPASRELYASTSLNYSSNGLYTGIFELNTTALTNAMAGESTISAWLEVNASYFGGDKQTLLQMPVKINNQLIA